MDLKKLAKRLCSGFLAFALVGALVPAALAAPPAGADIYSIHYVITGSEISDTELDEVACGKFTPRKGALIGNTDDEAIDLWVSSSDMTGDDYQIPYVKDGSGNTWYLQQIVLYDFINERNEDQVLMDAETIAAATSKEDYIFSVKEIRIAPKYGGYDLCYGWTMTPPNQWGGGSGTQETYTVTYDFNIPKDVNSIFPITDYGIRGNESSGSYDYINNKVAALTSTKLENQNFVVANGLETEGNSVWHGFFGYKWNDPNTEYYYFDGWMAEDGNEYETGDTATASSTLAGDDTEIKFTGVWEKVPKWTEEQLAKAEQEVPLDVFTRGDNGDLLIAQSTDTLTQKDNLISYTVSAAVNHDLLRKSNVPFKGSEFATFEIIINVDSNLEFANRNQDGTVTLRMESKLVVPKTITATNGDFTWTGNGETWTVTFDPDQLPSGENGSQIRIQAEFTDRDYTVIYSRMTLTGLDFKLKDSVFTSPDATLQVNTSANMTAKMNLRNMAGPTGFANNRYRLWVVEGLLGKNDANGEAWRAYFKGGVDDPTAYVHALQFLDYKLADYDLSTDNTATLKANTVEADILYGTVKITPADITIYMGGDHGYDAVVDGTTTDNADKPSNSMPTPLFYVDVSGVTVEDVEDDITLTGAQGREWKFRLAGKDSHGENLYYIDSTGFEGQDPVRVAFEGEDGTYHLNDTFDPAAVDELFTTYEISIYSGSAGTVLAQVDGKVHNVAVDTGTLTVRAVEETEDNPVVPVTGTVTAPVSAGSAAVTAPSGTTYTLNDTTVSVTGDGVGLLFDGIIDDATHNRTDALVEAIETDYRITVRDGYFQAQYLDLVDADNGNAWIKASNDVTVYWGYPEGTNQNTKFTLYHFTGLHRDGTNSGFDMEDISKSAIEVVDIEKTANGIAFDVEPGGFSPFVLVWEKPSWPIIIPDIPEDTTPNWLNLDDHDAYIQGYPDGFVKPQNNITRAEVATIFFRLLTDEAREYFWSTDSGFSDVKSSDWFNNAVSTMVNAGVITGYNDGTFRPNDPITRAEFATIAARFLSDPYSLQDQFYDTEGHWAEVYINRAAEVGWINGYNDGSFRPNKAITRAEAVTLVNNVLGREPHADYMLDDMITWPDNPKSAWYYEDIQEATNSHDYRWGSGKRYEIWTSLN